MEISLYADEETMERAAAARSKRMGTNKDELSLQTQKQAQ